MTLVMAGGLVGLVGSAGLVLTLVRLPLARRTTLDERVAPYLGGLPAATRGAVGRGAAASLRSRAAAALGGSASVRRRLERAGHHGGVEAFRAEQVVWASVGLLAGGTVATVLWWARHSTAGPLGALVVIAGVGGFVARDWLLSRQASRREARMLAEFPTVADLLALSVAAGEGPVAALERVVRVSSGELATELRRALADLRSGTAFGEALGALATRTGLPALARFVDGVVVAVERGTPLADVLQAQAQDVREARRRALVETAGRKEIAMMVPVVFLILPVTVLFAIYPGFAFMRLSL